MLTRTVLTSSFGVKGPGGASRARTPTSAPTSVAGAPATVTAGGAADKGASADGSRGGGGRVDESGRRLVKGPSIDQTVPSFDKVRPCALPVLLVVWK